MKRALALSVSLGLVAVAMSAPVSNAHVEEGCGLQVILVVALLQGECFTHGDAACDPDYDREHTRKDFRAFYTGGEGAFLPHSGCGLEFGQVHFPTATRAVALIGKISGLMTLAKYEVRLVVDGAVAQTATFTGVPIEAPNVYPFDLGVDLSLPLTLDLLTPTIPAGTHDVRLEYTVLQGPAYMNLFVDQLLFLDPAVCGVLNGPPQAPVGSVTDGLAGLPLGWAGAEFAYTFQAKAPGATEVLWSTADGLVPGETLEQALVGVGRHGLEILAVGAPLLQECPGMPAFPEGIPAAVSVGVASFETLPALQVELLDLAPRISCVQDRHVVLYAAGLPVIAGDCTLRASVEGLGSLQLAQGVVYTLDGLPVEVGSGDAFASLFHSLEHAAGEHVLRAEVQVEGDKFGRVFASDPHRFLNFGAV